MYNGEHGLSKENAEREKGRSFIFYTFLRFSSNDLLKKKIQTILWASSFMFIFNLC